MRLRSEVRLPRVGAYQLERLLGTGGMAEVFLATREGAHGFTKRVALKRILPQLACDPRLVAMFCDEARIQAALSHPNLVHVLDFGEHDGQLFMALELVEGLTSAELINRIAARRMTVDLGAALTIVREVLEALAYVHSVVDENGMPLGIVHRDIAPSNILIGKMGEVKLGDFGIMRSVAIDQRTAPGELKGKVGYCSPEQALGMTLDGRSDLFSVGVVLAELLICHSLFPGNTELEILVNLQKGNLRMLELFGRHIPHDIRFIIERSLARDPNDRFENAEELLAAVEISAQHHGVSLGAHTLAEWLADLGLIAISSDIQERLAPRLELQTQTARGLPSSIPPRPRMASDHPFSESVTLVAGEIELPADAPSDGSTASSLADALAQLLPENGRYSIPDELAHAVSTRMPDLPAARPGQVNAPDVDYRIRRTGGAIVGPLPLSRLLELVATGRLGPETEVSRDKGPFAALGTFFELSRLAHRPPYRFHEPFAMRAKERGPIRPDTLPRALFALARGRRTGLLMARRGAEQTRVYVVAGAPVFTASGDPRELLGSRLVAEGFVGRGQADMAIEYGWRRGLRSGDALIDAGLIKPAHLYRALVEQRRRRILGLFALRGGEVAWCEGVESGEESLPNGAPYKLIASCVAESYDEETIESQLEPIARGGLLTPGAGADTLVRSLELPVAETDALLRALHGRSLRTLVQEGIRHRTFDAPTARRAVFIALCAGILIHRG